MRVGTTVSKRRKRALIHVTAVRQRGRITLPESVRQTYGLHVGTQVLLVGDDRRLELVPAAIIARDQLWLFSDPIRDRIREAEEDVSCGRIRGIEAPDSLPGAIADLARP